jgi:hypothetical protein
MSPKCSAPRLTSASGAIISAAGRLGETRRGPEPRWQGSGGGFPDVRRTCSVPYSISCTVLSTYSCGLPPGELNTDSTATWRCGAPLLSSRFAVGPCEVHTKILLLKHSACGQTRVALLARVSIVTCLFRLSGHRFRESLACCLWNPLPEIPMATAVCQVRFSTFGVCAGCCRVQGDSPNPPSPDLCWIASNAPGVALISLIGNIPDKCYQLGRYAVRSCATRFLNGCCQNHTVISSRYLPV